MIHDIHVYVNTLVDKCNMVIIVIVYVCVYDDNFCFDIILLSPGETQTLLLNEPKWTLNQ